MKITLISPYSDITSLGMRLLSAVLKRDGYSAELIFLPHEPAETVSGQSSNNYSEEQLAAVAEVCKTSGLIGVSLMTNYFSRATVLTNYLKQSMSAPIIWGGIHPTIRPRECLEYADYVCVGEGEEALLQVAGALQNGTSTTSIANVFQLLDGSIVGVAPRPLLADLDGLPFPDYEFEQHWVWDDDAGKLLLMDSELMKKHLARGHISRIRNQVAYQTIATRGCPHNCSYCCNNVLRELYKGQTYLRRRSTETIINELAAAKNRLPFVEVIGFSDDSFFAESEAGIERFAENYRREINLPFFCLGSPVTITANKLRALTEAGLFGIQMGIQTGSPRTQARYNRRIENAQILAAARTINAFKDKMMPPTYDFIIDNPLEGRDDLLATLNLMLELPRPCRLQLFSLVIFPETGLYHQLVEQGAIAPFGPEAYDREYHQRQAHYLNMVLSLARNNVPRWLLRLLIHPWALFLLDRRSLNKLYAGSYRACRNVLLKVRRRQRS